MAAEDPAEVGPVLSALGGFKRELVEAAANGNVPLISGDDLFP